VSELCGGDARGKGFEELAYLGRRHILNLYQFGSFPA